MKNTFRKYLLITVSILTLLLITCMENHVLPDYGSIFITSDPEGAKVFFDGIDKGVTPLTIDNVLSGEYNVSLTYTDFYDSAFSVLVSENQELNSETFLREVNPVAEIILTSEPKDALIYLNGESTGLTTPATFSNLERGEYNFKLELDLYDDSIFNINLEKDESVQKNTRMIIAGTAGGLFISSTPSGAAIFLDNFRTEKVTPDTLKPLAAGNYTVKLTFDKYKDTTFSTLVDIGETTIENITLKALYNINTSVNPSNSGSVTESNTYVQGDEVTLEAVPSTGYSFINWTENDQIISADLIYIFIADGDRNLVANFSLNSYVVETSSNPANGGNTSGGGGFDFGDIANLTATPEVGYTFINWTENENVVSTEQNYSFTVNNSRTLVANFSLNNYVITTTSAPPNGGSTSGGGGFDFGNVANLTATPEIGYTFINWTENENVVSTDQNYTFTVNISRTLVANFSLNSYTITTNSNPSIGGSTSGGGIYNHGDIVELTANPSFGYSFVNWTENESEVSTSVSYQFTALSHTSLVANFIQNGILIINSDPQGADIFIDDAFTGEQTPGIIEDLLGGQYSVTLKLEDFADTTLSTDIYSGETTDLGTIFLRDITPSVVAYISYEVEPFTQRLNFIFSFNQDVRFTRVDVKPPQGPDFQWPFNNQLIPEGIETSFGVPEKIVGDWTFTCFGRKVDGRQAEFEYTDFITVE
jgi:Divergent InlB B-repeat domain/PEGA domain